MRPRVRLCGLVEYMEILTRTLRKNDLKQQTVLIDDKTVVNLSHVVLEEEDVRNVSLGQSRIDLFLFIRKSKLLKIHEIKRRKTPKMGDLSEPVSEDNGDMWRDNLLLEDITLMRELWELEENAMEAIDEEQVVARLDSEGVRLDKEGATGLKLKSRTVPAPCGDLIDQFSDTVTKGLKALRLKEMKKSTKNKSGYYKTLRA
ncbi:hypothetical protein NDU88_003607 [Pleurodeles waltl]|uniref:Uncharacterized protein n=1 Tax=Pleurodeles waltl TaxID=8319 RepID=A0AAV7L2A2_PLEWA|nr:hypothetical protein NDU88_003607 [Pleurodeles waltl]